MALHDAYLRRTPFELTFPDAEAAEDFTSSVASAGEESGVDLADLQAFVTLGAVSVFLRRLQPERAHAEVAYDYAMLLYHAFHFAHNGARPLLVSEATARSLVEGTAAGGDAGGRRLDAPGSAGYAQLPRNLFWLQSSPDAAAEAVDGFFWCLGDAGLLHVLLIAGIRDDRPGFAVVPLPEAPWADAATWLDAPIRPGGGDFATTLPGGELEDLYSFTAAGEVLKLVARLFAHVQARPGAPVDGSPRLDQPAEPAGSGANPAPPDGSGPARSALPYRRI